MFHSLIERLPQSIRPTAHFTAAAVDTAAGLATAATSVLIHFNVPAEQGSARIAAQAMVGVLGLSVIKWGEAAYRHIKAGRTRAAPEPNAHL